eukprot:COSAG06_NODE_3749_length_4946_cov_30.291521_2_plen_73_part_00
MQGHNVLHPMGWDAFGLPAEQYAIETGTHPAATTASNIEGFRGQLQVSTAEESVSIIYIRRDIRACKSAAWI